MTTLTLYELAGAEDDRRFSPYCWRVRLALAHKGLAVEGVPWRFTEKEAIAFSGQGRVPVLVDRGRAVADSWDIACHLEEAWPDRPSLFGAGASGAAGRALSRFYVDWTDMVVHAGLVRMIVADIHGHLHEKDKAYFRESREARLGGALEAVCADRDVRVVEFRRSLAPLRATLKRQPFLGGESPLFADYAVAGAFMWARAISPFQLLEAGDPVADWRSRILARLDETAAGFLAYPC
jgi:glutathione S-transferase